MACFLVPAAEAVVTTAALRLIEKRERATGVGELHAGESPVPKAEKLPFSAKLRWLQGLLWGGSALLAFEHLWHGEVVPWFPFLTAAADPGETAEMLREMSTVGVSMALLVTAVWLGMCAVWSLLEKRTETASPAEN